jgi:hypothetical protein
LFAMRTPLLACEACVAILWTAAQKFVPGVNRDGLHGLT